MWYNPQSNRTFYHGSSTACGIDYMLLPPEQSGKLQEESRAKSGKNLDQVFFTEDLGSAKVYAGRACKVFGGQPVIYRVIPMGDVVCINATAGSTVYHSGWAFVEKV